MNKTIKKLIRRFKTNDPFIIAEGLNIIVKFAEMDECTRGIYYRVLRRRFIVINRNLNEHWQRFVCAHELAHDRLHPQFNRFLLDAKSYANVGKYERQANMFAVHLLTAHDELYPGECLNDYLQRNNIPAEMDQFY